MNLAGVARVRACFEKAEEIISTVCPESRFASSQGLPRGSLSQMPQPKASVCRAIIDQKDEFEERAAIIEYDGGLPRLLAEFLAKRGRGQGTRT